MGVETDETGLKRAATHEAVGTAGWVGVPGGAWSWVRTRGARTRGPGGQGGSRYPRGAAIGGNLAAGGAEEGTHKGHRDAGTGGRRDGRGRPRGVPVRGTGPPGGSSRKRAPTRGALRGDGSPPGWKTVPTRGTPTRGPDGPGPEAGTHTGSPDRDTCSVRGSRSWVPTRGTPTGGPGGRLGAGFRGRVSRDGGCSGCIRGFSARILRCVRRVRSSCVAIAGRGMAASADFLHLGCIGRWSRICMRR